MTIKNYWVKRQNKRAFIFELIMPALIVAYLYEVVANHCDKADKDFEKCDKATKEINSYITPLIMCIVVPSAFSLSQRFIIQSMVEDKMNKMRESLKLMSLDATSYTLSIFGLQSIFAISAGLFFAVGMMFQTAILPEDTVSRAIEIGLAVFFFALAMIPYCMALSTFFNDSKVAN